MMTRWNVLQLLLTSTAAGIKPWLDAACSMGQDHSVAEPCEHVKQADQNNV